MTHTRYCDVCLIVRDVVKEIESESGGLSYPISVRGGILPVTAQRMSVGASFRIETSRRAWRSSQFYSTLFRYQHHAKIIYSSELNHCWKRFSVCKEVAHLLIDCEQTHFTTDVVGLIQRLITSTAFEADSLLDSEFMGIVAAVELLLPWKLRKPLLLMRDGGKTDLEIAEYCKVPEKFVNAMIRSKYGTHSHEINTKLDGESTT